MTDFQSDGLGSTPRSRTKKEINADWYQRNSENKKKYQRDHYDKNKDHIRSRIAGVRQKKKDWVAQYKKNKKCLFCPEDHVSCLDFHHIDPSEKDIEVGYMLGNGYSLERIQAEIKKCIILCANCHRKLHYGLKEFSP